MLLLDWTPCELMMSHNETTPPVTRYNVSVNDIMVASVTDNCTIDDISLTGLNMFTFEAFNIFGSSKVMSSFNVDFLQNITGESVNNSTAIVEYTTVKCLKSCNNFTVELIYNNSTTSTAPYVINTTSSFTLSSLQPGATVSYTLQVMDFTATSDLVMLPTIIPSSSSSSSSVTSTPSSNYNCK
jgi:hypothetical protein